MLFNRTHNIEDVNANMKDQDVILAGWVEDLRKMGKMTFLTLRDVTGITQIILTDELTKSSRRYYKTKCCKSNRQSTRYSC